MQINAVNADIAVRYLIIWFAITYIEYRSTQLLMNNIDQIVSMPVSTFNEMLGEAKLYAVEFLLNMFICTSF